MAVLRGGPGCEASPRAPHKGPCGAEDPDGGRGGTREPAWRGVSRHRVAPGEGGEPRGAHPAEAPGDVPPVQGAGGARHHGDPDGGGADDPLRDGRDPRRCRDADVRPPGPIRSGGVRGRAPRGEPARGELPLRPSRLREAGRRVRHGLRGGEWHGGVRRGRGGGGRLPGARPLRGERRRWGEPLPDPVRPAGHDAERGRDHPGLREALVRPRDNRPAAGTRGEGRVARKPRVQRRLAHRARPAQPPHLRRGCGAGGAREGGEPGRAHAGRLPREGSRVGAG